MLTPAGNDRDVDSVTINSERLEGTNRRSPTLLRDESINHHLVKLSLRYGKGISRQLDVMKRGLVCASKKQNTSGGKNQN